MSENETPALSPSIAHALVTECPRQAWAEHRLLGDCVTVSDEARARRERGQILHHLVLEDGARIAIVDADSWRTKAAKEQRDEARADGRLPLLHKDGLVLGECADVIRGRIEDLGVDLDTGRAEHKLRWGEESHRRGEVLCTGVLDWHSDDGQRWIDLKTTTGSVHPDACAAAIVRSHAAIQECAYTSALASTYPEAAGRIGGTFVFAQSVPPYLVTPVTCAGDLRELGEARWLRAIDVWAGCLAKGVDAEHWPEHTQRPMQVHAPAWALAAELTREGMDG